MVNGPLKNSAPAETKQSDGSTRWDAARQQLKLSAMSGGPMTGGHRYLLIFDEIQFRPSSERHPPVQLAKPDERQIFGVNVALKELKNYNIILIL